MFRKRLKSRTGCDRCRIRHKKCDERKPKCGTCQRLNLLCTWPLIDSGAKTVSAAAYRNATKIGTSTDLVFEWIPPSRHQVAPMQKCLGQGYTPLRDQVQFDLIIQSSVSLRGLISQSANPDFQDTSFLITLALQNNWLRDAFASFSAYTYLAPSKNDHVRSQLAPTLYQNALSALRGRIESIQTHDEMIKVLGATIFIGMSDSLGTGDPARAVVHFSAAASICKVLPFTAAKTPAERMLYRIAVECWLYHLATLSLFQEDCDKIMQCIDWSILPNCLEEPTLGKSIFLHTSPFLGGTYRIYKLILQMTWYARQDEPLTSRLQQTSIWSGELDNLLEQPQAYFAELPRSVAQLYFSKFVLHIYALRILLEKIADHDIHACSPHVRVYIDDAQMMLESSPIRERRNPALAWPLVVFLCAANEQPVFDFFIEIMMTVSENFDEGHMRRMYKVIETINEQRTRGHCGLDLLLRRKGIFVPNC